MAYASLVASELTPELQQAGAEYLHALDNAGLGIPAAFWILPPEEAGWKLVIASPEVATKGPRAFYKKVDKILRKQATGALTITMISAASPSHPLIELLRTAIRTGHVVSGIRFTQNVINGVLVPDAFIYRME